MQIKHYGLVVLILLLVHIQTNANAQEFSYRFLDLQVSYPSNCTIHAFEQGSSSILGKNCSFVVSALFSDGSEERMKVKVESSTGFELLSLLAGDKDINGALLSILVQSAFDGLSASPAYSHLSEDFDGNGAQYAYKDFSGRFYPSKRESYSSTLYYKKIKGRIYYRIFGDYVISFCMIVPARNNFKTLQKIAESLTYAY